MGSRLSHRILYCAVASSLFACGSDLVLPDDKAPVTLRAISGDGQEATVGTRLPEPLVALLTDGAARPVPGVPFTFRFQGDFPGAKIDPPAAETDESGLVRTRVTLGTATGPYTIEAVVAQGADLSTTFGVTAVPKEHGHDGDGEHPGRDQHGD
jgi:hypothetical protein